MDLFDLIGNIRKRPVMYLGELSIGQLRTFLAGYSFARRQMQVPQTQQEKVFSTFQPWVEQHFGISSQQHWDQIILEASKNEAEAVERFFILFDEFTVLQNGAKSSSKLQQIDAALNFSRDVVG